VENVSSDDNPETAPTLFREINAIVPDPESYSRIAPLLMILE
jgi:hypothetical protein